jgi:hypothetical protein
METKLYIPKGGTVSVMLAYRKKTLSTAFACLDNLRAGFPQQPVLYYGLHGAGKTALLNAIELAAADKNILYRHIEAGENKAFTGQLTSALSYFGQALGKERAAEDTIQKYLSLLETFKRIYSPMEEHNKVGMEGNFDTLELTGVYSEDLCEIFVRLGTAAKRTDQAVCIFVDEIQHLSREELHGLVSSLHRCTQLRLPITVFGAGLPEIIKKVGDVCSYSERLFRFEEISALSDTVAPIL